MTDAPTLVSGNVNYNTITFIDYSNSRVGINTTTPQYDLDVNGSTYSQRYLFGTSPSVYQRLDYNAGGYGYWTTTTGTEVLYVNNSGNVGIGTNSPATKLSVNGTTSTTTALVNGASAANIFTVSGFAYAPSLASQVNSSLTYSTGFNFSPALDISNLDLTNGNSTYLSFSSINSGGSRVSGAQIGGVFNDHLGSSAFPDTSIVFLTGFGGAAPSERFRITSSGNVGIGTNAPGYKLDVRGTGFFYDTSSTVLTLQGAGSGRAQLQFLDDSGVFKGVIQASAGGELTFASGSGTDIAITSDSYSRFITNGNERMRIISAGYVGIGLTNPESYIHARAFFSSGNDCELYLQSGDDGNSKYGSYIKTLGSSGFGQTAIGKLTASGGAAFTQTEYIRINASGNVGIGTTSPSSKLDLWDGALTLHNDDASKYTTIQTLSNNFVTFQDPAGFNWIEYDNPNRKLTLGGLSSQNSARLWITSSGDVGMGTSTPATKLHVYGGDFRLDNGTGYQSFSAGSSYGVWKTQSGTESITVNQSSAYTGIGTNAPTNQFTVGTGADAGTGVPTGIIKLQGAGASGTLTHTQVGSVNGPALYAKSGIGGALSSDAALQFEVNRSSTASVAMTIASSSNVGIGITNPSNKLSIVGPSLATYTDSALKIGDGLGNVYIGAGLNSIALWTNGGTQALTISQSNGYVGIGTTNPNKGALHVYNAQSYNNGGGGIYYWNSFSATTIKPQTGFNSPVGIYSDNWIVSSVGFVVDSDNRVKKNKNGIPSSLSIIEKLNPVQYDYVDYVKYKDGKYGFIAQEVESVCPTIVKTDTGYVPTIFQLCKYEMSNHSIIVFCRHNLNTTNHGKLFSPYYMKFIDSKNRGVESKVEIIDEDRIKTYINLDEYDFINNQIFVYGPKVEDFKQMDYEQIHAISIAGIQELNSNMEKLKNELNAQYQQQKEQKKQEQYREFIELLKQDYILTPK